MYSQRLYNIRVLLSLTTTNERWVKVSHVHDQDGVICLSSACDHVRNEVPVTRGIKEHNFSVLQSDLLDTNVNRHSSHSFLLSRVSHPCVLERFLADLLWLFFVFMDLLLGNNVDFMQEHTDQSWFTRVNVTDYNDIESSWWFDILLNSNDWILLIVMRCVVVFWDTGGFSRVDWRYSGLLLWHFSGGFRG